MFTVALLLAAATSLLSVPHAAGLPSDASIGVTIAGTAGTNGWYRSNVTVTWNVTGATSSQGCDIKTLTADTTGTTLTCQASDDTSTVSRSVTIKIDKTAPTVSGVASRNPDANGWYNHALTVSFAGTDATSGIASCSSAGYSGPDNANASVGGSCADNAGNVGTAGLPFKYDATPPAVTAAPSRPADSNGWYNHALSVSYSGTDATSGVASCTSAGYSAPDAPRASVAGSCTDRAGNVGTASLAIAYDATPPVVTAAASRPTDSNGWYNHALTVGFSGADATSGIASCTSVKYSGPASAIASAPGSCTDKAGNTGTASLQFSYDSTPPIVSRLAATPGNRRVDLRWASSADVEGFVVTRTPGLGQAKTSVVCHSRKASCMNGGLSVGKGYRFTVTGFDQAGNAKSVALSVTATGPLTSPPPAARLKSPPLLEWTPMHGASYYNVQLVRDRKVLSVWPHTASFRLPRAWRFDGRRYRLNPGTYHWYVWPGFGRLSAGKYGRRIGGSTFVVVKS